MKNQPDDWHVPFAKDFVGINATFPLDGRETIFDPYEAFCPTDTVARFTVALTRVRGRDADLPHDFDLYLAQRIPSAAFLSALSPLTAIDRYGKAV